MYIFNSHSPSDNTPLTYVDVELTSFRGRN